MVVDNSRMPEESTVNKILFYKIDCDGWFKNFLGKAKYKDCRNSEKTLLWYSLY